jgi:hypothetical protein
MVKIEVVFMGSQTVKVTIIDHSGLECEVLLGMDWLRLAVMRVGELRNVRGQVGEGIGVPVRVFE